MKKYDLVSTLMLTSMNVCMQSLGPNHVQVAQLHVDLAQLQIRNQRREKAMQHLEQA